MLSTAAQNELRAVRVLTIDETVVEYQPSKEAKAKAAGLGAPIPVVYIPRKPHPNGLEVMTVATYVDDPNSRKGAPFVVMLLPHVKVGDVSPVDVVKAAVDKLSKKWGPAPLHWVFDAGFGSVATAKEVESHGDFVTCSVSMNQVGELWDALTVNLPTNRWRAAVHGSIVASCHAVTTTTQDGVAKRAHQRVISNGWEWTKADRSIGGAEEQESDGSGGGGDGGSGSGGGSAGGGDGGGGGGGGGDNSGDKIPQYKEENLREMTVSELREICKKWNIKSGGRKDVIIDNILSRVSVVHKQFSRVQEVEAALNSPPLPDPGPLHDFYLHNFNWVDMANKELQTVEEHHHHRSWEFKLLIILLRFGTLNASKAFARKNGLRFVKYRQQLAEALITK